MTKSKKELKLIRRIVREELEALNKYRRATQEEALKRAKRDVIDYFYGG